MISKFKNIVGMLLVLIALTACKSEIKKSVEIGSSKIDIIDTDDSDMEIDLEIEEALDDIETDEIEDILVEETIDIEIEQALKEIEQEEDIDLVNELIELEGQKQTGEASKGRCDSIAEGSICMGYYGSFWSEAQMKLNCGDAGVFSTKPCPLDSLGGCNLGNGGPGDTVMWFYNRGGSPKGNSIQSSRNVCNDNPMGRWINAKSGQFEN